MAPTVPTAAALRKIFEEHISLLAIDVEALFEAELESRACEIRRLARRELADDLNQALRRLRQVESFSEAAAIVVDSATSFSNGAAMFSIYDTTVRGECARGRGDAVLERFNILEFPLSQAAAFAGAIETREPVIAMSTAREVSAAVAAALGNDPNERVFLFPIAVRGKIVGLFCAYGAEEMAPLELLSQAAGLQLEICSQSAPAPPTAELVTIQPATPPQGRIPESWSELKPEDREAHLRAQRFARVQVAGLKLYAAEAVKAGRASRSLYTALQKDIDAGREVFRQTFITANPTMVDYFHLELLRSLANEDVALLGESYPGPLV